LFIVCSCNARFVHAKLGYKRLNFGIKTAAEIFHKVEELTSGIDHLINISDDIIIGGVDIEDNDKKT
jgi:hypothetical protein